MMNALLFISSFVLYLVSMAPSITVGDSGEFCAAGVILGLPHSPGYPLYCLLAKAFTVLLPWGNLAYRVNLLSAVAAAGSISLLYTALRILEGVEESPAYAIAVLLLAVSPVFWHSAIQAEVFALNTLFAVGILYAFAAKSDYAAVFLFGLGLGNHQTLIFLGPLLLWMYIKNGGLTLRRAATGLAFFAVGFSVYAYLPLRSFKNPALDWGNPETLHNLWRVISRADYGTTALTTGEKIGRTLATQAQQIHRLLSALSVQFTLAGILAGIAGWYLVVRKRAGTYGILFLTWCLIGPGFLLLANMPFDAQTTGILERFYILVIVFWIIPVAWFLREASAHIGRRLFAVAGIIVVALAVYARSPEASWRNYYLAYDYGRNLFRTLAPGSVFFMQGGDDTFYSTAYLQFAEKRRTDVELHDRGGLVFASVYGGDFRGLTRDEKERRCKQVERAYVGLRPVYYSTFDRTILPGISFTPDGVLYCAGKGNDTYAFYSLRSVYTPQYHDYRSRELVPIYPYFAALRPGVDRLSYWGYLYSRWSDVLWISTNMHVELSQEAFRQFNAQSLDAAEKIYRNIIALFPDDTATLINLGVIQERKKNRAAAKNLYSRAIEVNPQVTDAYYNIAVLAWQEGDWGEVVQQLERLQQVSPQDARAQQYLPPARAKLAAQRK